MSDPSKYVFAFKFFWVMNTPSWEGSKILTILKTYFRRRTPQKSAHQVLSSHESLHLSFAAGNREEPLCLPPAASRWDGFQKDGATAQVADPVLTNRATNQPTTTKQQTQTKQQTTNNINQPNKQHKPKTRKPTKQSNKK